MGRDWKGIIRVLALPDPPASQSADKDRDAFASSIKAGADFSASPEVPTPWVSAPVESLITPNTGELGVVGEEDSGLLSNQLRRCWI